MSEEKNEQEQVSVGTQSSDSYTAKQSLESNEPDNSTAAPEANQPSGFPIMESIGAGAMAGAGAGIAAHYFAGGKLIFPIWIAL